MGWYLGHYTHEQYLAGNATLPFIINGVLIKPRVRVKMGRRLNHAAPVCRNSL